MSNSNSINYSKFQQFIIACSLCLFFLPTSAQDIILKRVYDFDKDQKFETPKKSKFDVDVKTGKLYIQQKSNSLQEFGLFPLVYGNYYYNVESKFDLKFIDGKESGFGMSFITGDSKGSSNYINVTRFILTPNGDIKYYSGPLINEKTITSLPAEHCPSFKPLEINKIQFLRNYKDWYLIINGDTVKHSTEKDFYPIINVYSGKFEMFGKFEVEIDNFSFVGKSDKSTNEEQSNKLNAIPGSYLTYSSCLTTATKRTTLVIKRENIKSYNFILTGLGDTPISFFLEENKTDIFTSTQELTLTIGNVDYYVRTIKLTQQPSNKKFNLTFTLVRLGSIKGADCEFNGTN